MARFYVLAIEPTLFGDTAVVREWGRIGSLGRRRLDLYPEPRPPPKLSTSGWIERRGVAIGSERQACCPDRRRRDADAIGPKWSSIELPRVMDIRGFVAHSGQNVLKPTPTRGRFRGVMDHVQLELFSDRPLTAPASNSGPTRRIVAKDLSDEALIAALPDALLADACALAAKSGRRRLGDAASALVALCHRFVGFGVDRVVPEQVAALEALGAIGGTEASRWRCQSNGGSPTCSATAISRAAIYAARARHSANAAERLCL